MASRAIPTCRSARPTPAIPTARGPPGARPDRRSSSSPRASPAPPPGVAIDAHAHGSHGARSTMAYGHYDYAIDPLRYTQAPGTHWYHAHKHGSTALHVLNGQVGVIEVHGEFDRKLEAYFKTR